MVDYILTTTVLFTAGLLGQILDINLNFEKNMDGIRKSDNTPFDESTGIGTLLKFYLHSRRFSILRTTVSLFILSLFGNTELIGYFFPVVEGRAVLFFLAGYGGQQLMRDMMSKAIDKFNSQ